MSGPEALLHNTESGQNPARNADRPGALLHNIESGQNPAIHTKKSNTWRARPLATKKTCTYVGSLGSSRPPDPPEWGVAQNPPGRGIGGGVWRAGGPEGAKTNVKYQPNASYVGNFAMWHSPGQINTMAAKR